MDTVPRSFRKQVSAVKSFLSIQGGKLDWESIMRLAGAFDSENSHNRIEMGSDVEPEVTEVWAATVPQPLPTPYSRTVRFPKSTLVPSNQTSQGSFYQQDMDDSTKRSSSNQNLSERRIVPEVSCFYCKRPGHLKKDCWRLNDKCLACGSDDHRISNCTRRKSLHSSFGISQGQVFSNRYPSGTSYSSENERALAGLGTPRQS